MKEYCEIHIGEDPPKTSNALGAVWETSGACVVAPIASLVWNHICIHVHIHILIGVNVRCDHSGGVTGVSEATTRHTSGVCLGTL